MRKEGIYNSVITGIFNRYYKPGLEDFDFNRDELPEIANQLGIIPPKNLGDLLYSFRYIRPLTKVITDTAPQEWNGL